MTITLGTFMADLTASTQQVFNSILPVIYLLLGILLGFFILHTVIEMLDLYKKKDNGIMDE